ncbi:MAG TPA: hypothetical protein PK413_01320 [Thermoanaerobaculia bacterium]|nr:hypothetical protein [Thermoanaerobaculia bacterium]
MIPGYNTDVRHGDVVFHVQTEDKGTENPYIETLVYVGGRVVAAKRGSYSQLLAEGKGPPEISAMMETQHRAIIAAIKQGRFDAKLEGLLSGSSAAVKKPGTTTSSVPTAQPAAAPAPPRAAVPAPELVETSFREPELRDDLLSATKITENERTLDQVILEYLLNEAEQEHLLLAVESDRDLSLGQGADLMLLASSSKSGAGVQNVSVEVRLISTVAEARTLASGRTDFEGRLRLAFAIPEVRGGAAALIINAESQLGSAELKHLLA